MGSPGELRRRAGAAARRAVPFRARVTARSAARRVLGRNRLATPADLRSCYRLLLGRTPDRRGELDFLSLIERGMTTDELVQHFVSSPEYRARQVADGSSGVAPVEVRVDDVVFRIDPEDFAIGPHLARPGGYEPDVLVTLQRALEPGGTFVDVGASFGYFSTRVGRHVGPEGTVVAFEPGPQNQSLLLFNLAANGVDTAEVRQLALGAEPGLFAYSRSGANGVVSRFRGDPNELANHDLVRVSTLDRELAGRSVDALKVDAEGAEGLVLAGGRELLADSRPTVVFEFSPPALESVSDMSGSAVLRMLEGLGYSVGVIGGGVPSALRPQEILGRYERAPEGHLNLVAWHED
jgi:FkbM family methyltransferase